MPGEQRGNNLGVGELAALGVKALNGGLFVVAFALVAEVLAPKRFSGVFSAAPSVALANLVVVVIAKGSNEGLSNTTGMLVGALGMAVASLAGIKLVDRKGALRGSIAVCGVWLAVSVVGYLLFVV